MKQQAASHQQGDRPSPVTPLEHRATLGFSLTQDQVRVLDCLSKAGQGLTARQLESRSACSGEALERALAGLMEQRLVARLNTIIPSYTARQDLGI